MSKLGIVGLPASGKSLLYTLLTENEGGGASARVGVAKVPDRRLQVLATMFNPRKTTPATIELTDLPGFQPGSDRARLNEFLNGVRGTDALIHVVRAFESETVPHLQGSIDPARDADAVDTELLLADLEAAESGRKRLREARRREKAEEQVLELLERIVPALEEGRPVREQGLDEEAERLLRGYGFFTARPLLVAVNVSEEGLRSGAYPGRERLEAYCRERGEELVVFSGPLEAEIAALPAEERETFLAEYGIEEPGIHRVARAAYRALGLISFLTAGEDEVRAWPIRHGTAAKAAAGRIHSDIEKGFIRAEVYAFDALERLGSVKALRDAGLLRLEGREYIVQDGDVVHFRFNV